jgi:hypothetical protein
MAAESRRRISMGLVAVAVALGFSTVAPAQLTTVVEAREVLMHAQAADAHLLVRSTGADVNSPLLFSSSVDPAARTFRYLLQPGGTYCGQPIGLMLLR